MKIEKNQIKLLYTDGQKKHHSQISSCIACVSQTPAAQVYLTRILRRASGLF